MKWFLAYCGRWQLSSPILALVVWLFPIDDIWIKTILANFIGACIFFWVDRIIFKKEKCSDNAGNKQRENIVGR